MVGRSGWNLATGDTRVGTTVTQLKASHSANAQLIIYDTSKNKLYIYSFLLKTKCIIS
jgi:hypothetical protein